MGKHMSGLIVPRDHEMEVERPDGTTVTVNAVQLVTWKHAIRLEALGMRHSKGSVNAHAKKVLGLPKGMRREKVVGVIQDILDQYEERRTE